MKYRPCKLSDIVNVERHNNIIRYNVDEDGQPRHEFDNDWDNNHDYDETSTEYECTNYHQDVMTADSFEGWDEALQHLKDYGDNDENDEPGAGVPAVPQPA